MSAALARFDQGQARLDSRLWKHAKGFAQAVEKPSAVIRPPVSIVRIHKIPNRLPIVLLNLLEQMRAVQPDLPHRLPKQRKPHSPGGGNQQSGKEPVAKIHPGTFAGTIQLASDSD